MKVMCVVSQEINDALAELRRGDPFVNRSDQIRLALREFVDRRAGGAAGMIVAAGIQAAMGPAVGGPGAAGAAGAGTGAAGAGGAAAAGTAGAGGAEGAAGAGSNAVSGTAGAPQTRPFDWDTYVPHEIKGAKVTVLDKDGAEICVNCALGTCKQCFRGQESDVGQKVPCGCVVCGVSRWG